METEIAYDYEVTAGYPFKLNEIIYEGVDGHIYSKPVDFSKRFTGRFTGKRIKYLGVSKNGKSGDGAVPYTSLSWCNTWHHDQTKVKISHDPKEAVSGLSSWVGLTPVENAYRYESVEVKNNKTHKTVVVEFDNVDHRNIIKSAQFLELLVKELLSAKSQEEIKETLKEAEVRVEQLPLEHKKNN